MYGIWAMRSRASVFGPAAAWCKDAEGKAIKFDTKEEAEKEADRLNKEIATLNTRYVTKKM